MRRMLHFIEREYHKQLVDGWRSRREPRISQHIGRGATSAAMRAAICFQIGAGDSFQKILIVIE
jgi:hypothetical protein